MKPHPRIRKTIKWGGAAVTVLLVVVWIGSAWFVAWFRRGGDFAVWGGHVLASKSQGMSTGHFDDVAGVQFGVQEWSWWDPLWDVSYSQSWYLIRIPLSLPFLVMILLTVAAWRLDILARRRALLNLCPKCNYDRAGIAKDAVCPECGLRPG